MFTIDLAMKDLRLALDLAASVSAGTAADRADPARDGGGGRRRLRRSRTSPPWPSTCGTGSGHRFRCSRRAADPSMQGGMRRWSARRVEEAPAETAGRPGGRRRPRGRRCPAGAPAAGHLRLGVDGATLYLSPHLEELLGCRSRGVAARSGVLPRADPSGRPGARGGRARGATARSTARSGSSTRCAAPTASTSASRTRRSSPETAPGRRSPARASCWTSPSASARSRPCSAARRGSARCCRTSPARSTAVRSTRTGTWSSSATTSSGSPAIPRRTSS